MVQVAMSGNEQPNEKLDGQISICHMLMDHP